jgi:hypothetical protein
MATKDQTPDPITVTINEQPYELRCSRHARKIIDQTLGGIQPAIDAVRNVNCDSLAAIVIAGSGIKLNGRKADQLADAIWQSPSEVIGPISDFVVRMANGGRDPEPEEEDENPPKPAAKAKQASE